MNKHKFMHSKIITTLFSLASAVSICACNYMIVEQKNGEKISFLLADKPVLTYHGRNLVINSNSSTTYAIDDIKNYHFGDDVVSLDGTLFSNSLKIINIDRETIEIQNTLPYSDVRLFSSNGVQVLSSKTSKDGHTIVKLPIQQGIYMLTIGSQSFKIIRK